MKKIHLWLGLTSGLIVFISILPAAIFVWDDELTNWWYSEYVYVTPQQTKQPLSVLLANAQSAYKEKEILWIEIVNNPKKSYIFQTYKDSEKPGWSFFSEIEYWDKIFVNPYNGEILGTVDMRYDWIYLCRIMHQQLLLRYEIGHWPVAIATLIMFVMLLSGIVLWWPRNKNTIKQRFTIKWHKVGWKRINYDLHSTGGFYILLFVIIFAITGLVWSFKWWENGIYRLMGDNPTAVFKNVNHLIPKTYHSDTIHPINKVNDFLMSYKQSIERYSISIDKDEKNEIKEYSAWVEYKEQSLWDESDYLFFHPASGELIHQFTHNDKTLGEKWRNSNYSIHVGSIWGMPTKILASLVALICSILPLTGFIIWIKKGRKRMPAGNTQYKKLPVQ